MAIRQTSALPRSARRSRKAVLAIAAAFLALIASACGSSGSGSSGSSSATAAAAAGSGSTAAGSSAGTGAYSQVAGLVTQLEARPTQIPITTPIGKQVPSGKTVAYVSCGIPSCVASGKVLQQAVSILDWKLEIFNTTGTPQSFQAAFDQVIQAKPNAVMWTAIETSAISSQLLKLQSMGVLTAACCTADSAGGGLDFDMDNAPQQAPKGDAMGLDALAVGGPDTQAVYVNLPDYPILDPLNAAVQATFAEYCPKTCSVSTLQVPLAEIADAPSMIVSYLRSHPQVKSVILSVDGLLPGLPAALKAAGLTGIKITGQNPNPASLDMLKAGQELGTIQFDVYDDVFSMVDYFARRLAGVAPQPSHPLVWLTTAENVAPNNGVIVAPDVADNNAQWAKLWGKSAS
jgi:ABC-type sugar transport system substrate-binding protein